MKVLKAANLVATAVLVPAGLLFAVMMLIFLMRELFSWNYQIFFVWVPALDLLWGDAESLGSWSRWIVSLPGVRPLMRAGLAALLVTFVNSTLEERVDQGRTNATAAGGISVLAASDLA